MHLSLSATAILFPQITFYYGSIYIFVCDRFNLIKKRELGGTLK